MANDSPETIDMSDWAGHERGSTGYKRLLVALFFAGIATFAQLYSPQAALPQIAAELGVSAAGSALLISMATLGLAVGVVPWSIAADCSARCWPLWCCAGGRRLCGNAPPGPMVPQHFVTPSWAVGEQRHSDSLTLLIHRQPSGVGFIYVLGGTGVVSAGVAEELESLTSGSVSRLSGPDRYGTSVQAASLWTDADTVYLASGLMFADALSGGAAAAREEAPLLLTRDRSVPAETVAELVRLDPDNVVIVGGTDVVSDAVVDAVQAALPGAAITRRAGADRYATSATLLRDGFDSAFTRLMVASGLKFADALAGVPASVETGSAFVISKKECLSPSITSELAPGEVDEYVLLGGQKVLDDAVATTTCPK